MLNELTIKALEAKGFSRWQKGGYDRLYINAFHLGLECAYHKTGSIKLAEFRGDHISNSEAYRMKNEKTYINIENGKVFSGRDDFRALVQEMLDEAIASVNE